MFVQFWIVVAPGTTSCVSPAAATSSPRILPASALVTALVFVAHVCGGAVAAVNTTCLAILLIVALPVVAAAASFPARIFCAGLRPILIVIRLLVAAASALPIVALTTATAASSTTLSILII